MHQFINAIAKATGSNRELAVGNSSKPCTTALQAMKVTLGNDEIVLLDTPDIDFSDTLSKKHYKLADGVKKTLSPG